MLKCEYFCALLMVQHPRNQLLQTSHQPPPPPLSLIFSEVEQNRKDRVTNLVAMSCMLVVVTVMYFLMVLPVFFLQRKRQASSLRLFLAVPRAVVIRQYRKYREAMTGSQGLLPAHMNFHFSLQGLENLSLIHPRCCTNRR